MIALTALVPGLRAVRAATSGLRPRYPASAETASTEEILRLVQPLRILACAVLRAAAPVFAAHTDAADVLRLDQGGPPRKQLRSLVARARDDYARGPGKGAREAAERLVGRVNRANKAQLRVQLEPKLSINPFAAEPWLEGVVSATVNEATASITGIPDRFFSQLEDRLDTGFRRGLRWEEIAADLERDFVAGGLEVGIAARRARGIARDTVGTLNSKLTLARFHAAGVDRYRWRTARDERVRGNPGGKYPDARPSHFAREGKVYSVDDPPEGGHPGEARFCRCVPEPIIEESGDTGEDEAPKPSTIAAML